MSNTLRISSAVYSTATVATITVRLYTRVAVNTIRDVTSPLERLGLNLAGQSPPS